MREIVIASACRTPLAKFQGSLSSVKATDLGAHVIKEALNRANVKPDMVDEVIMGCVLQAGLGQNPARQALIHAGIPNTVGATTINKVCGSGLKAVMMAAQAIKAEDCDLIVAGGMENMSQAPYIMRKARDGFRMGHTQIDDVMVADGLWDVYNDFHMGSTAELVSREYKIDRETQDEYAFHSQTKASNAQKAGKFKAEIAPIEVKQRRKTFLFEEDEGIKHDVSLEGLAKPRAAFEKDGTVTAGNASTINDGASAVVVTHKEYAKKHGLKIMATIKAYETGGMAPEWVMMAPAVAIDKLYKKAGVNKDDIDLFEINEAFAVASVALKDKLQLDPDKINVNGGAIALGHPIGASGTRILTTLLHSLEDQDKKTGVAALCLGGGNAVAMLIERTN
ncbi:MAG: acetyl-CoA C-acetyltransferase [Candidatus Cloacimonetes bacterium]|nr:acetyl-CoA C-acetyltransferase [Candidatus Cloacimonadota bacterium]